MSVEIVTSFDQITDVSGGSVSGALVYVYAPGTTTPLSLFSDTGLSVSAANPIVTDSSGRHDMRYVATGSYKIVVKTSTGTTLYTRDNIDGRVPVGSGALAIVNGGTGSDNAAGALAALGGATAAELADVSADVAAVVGALGSSEKTHLATGTTAQRPDAPTDGDVRRNTTIPQFEGYAGSLTAWKKFLMESDISDTATAQAATSTTTVMTPANWASAHAVNDPFVAKLYHLQDQKTQNTVGGTLSAATWNKRTLNTAVVAAFSGASVASSVVTLPAGTYRIWARCPYHNSNNAIYTHQARWANTTDSTYSYGSSSAAFETTTDSVVNTTITIAGAKNFELQHNISNTNGTSDGGKPCNVGTEVYSEVMIWKIA